ncbi:TlpA family protein disulfide reductase [Spelaeicoccus albus]|uniref:Peroxiredoxin n=1 Tax=Spelaeicoccus albus TaxID=1280376 RepID=A0A7Z0D5T0_9MICO|nr:TlpA disulfide reductase family protein [Spelaeicoccus albus]NYI69383.1 peroxiredoxin [Spelaeicoccus albus]
MIGPETPRRTVLRSALAATGTAALGVALAACGDKDSLSEQANSGSDKGYIAGDGVVTQLPPSKRGHPVEAGGKLLNGKHFDLADWRGNILVLNLWYAACPPCRKEAKDVEAAYRAYKDKGVRFLGVNVRDGAAAAKSYMRTFDITYPVMLDTAGRVVSALHGVLPPEATPSTLLLDPKGRIAGRVVGEVDKTTLKGMIGDLRT